MSSGSSRSVPGGTVLQALRKARALIAKGWTQGTFAKDRDGISVDVNDPDACRFCAAGAVLRVCGSGSLFDKVLSGALGGLFPRFNDLPTTKKSDVLRVFDEAIKKVRRG